MTKKIIVIVFVILILSAVLALTSCAGKEELGFTFVTDTHIIANDFFTSDNMNTYLNVDKMVHLTEAVFNTIADDIIASKTKFLLLGGDLTEHGDLLSHQACINTLNRIKSAGISVYVINGNHDIAQNLSQTNKISADKFRELYSDFGYSQAIATYEGTLSYTADLNKKFRLIAIDNITYQIDENTTKEALSLRHNEWIIAQVDACIAAKKTPVIVSHIPFLLHMPKVIEAFYDKAYYQTSKKLVTAMANKGAKFAFNGHLHMQDVISLTTDKDNTFTDICTGSTSFYPASYRKVSFKKKKVDISTVPVGNLNAKYLAALLPDEVKTAVTADFRGYCLEHLHGGLSHTISRKLDIANILNINYEEGSFLDVALDKFLSNPLYIKDEDNNVSFQRILNEYGVVLPQTDHKTMMDIAVFYVATLMGGDQNIAGRDENTIMKHAVKTLFYYINEQSDNLAVIAPNHAPLNIDLEKLYNEGILECYDSNLIPIALDIIGSSYNNFLIDSILSSVSKNFNALDDYQVAIDSFTNGQLAGITSYFDYKSIRIDDLIDDIFDIYLADFMTDLAPPDNNLSIAR